jgi:hypothetical protein
MISSDRCFLIFGWGDRIYTLATTLAGKYPHF